MQDRARRTREHVLQAAMEEFATHGYTNTTMNAVAARIGMTKGALYGHFASKEELTAAITRQANAAWQHLQADCSPPGTAPLAALHAVVVALARALREDIRIRAAYRLLSDGAPGGGAQGFFPDIQRHLAGLVRRAQDAGTVSSAHPPGATARLLLSVVLGTHAASLLPPGVGFSLGIEAAWDMVTGSLTVATPRG